MSLNNYCYPLHQKECAKRVIRASGDSVWSRAGVHGLVQETHTVSVSERVRARTLRATLAQQMVEHLHLYSMMWVQRYVLA